MLATLLLLAVPAFAADDGEIPRLIRQLDADEFAERQAATQKLQELGKAALPALEEATVGDSREASTRAFEILKTHLDKGVGDVKEAAKEALGRIAKGNNPAAAKRADEMLKPAPTPKTDPAAPVAPALRIAGVPLRIAVAGAGAKRVTTKSVNGVKDIDVEEGERKIKIHDDPAKGIEVEVTEKKDGKDATEKYEAKNADELKTKHPEAHKLYEQYKDGGAALRLGALAGLRAALPFPAAAPVFPEVPPPPVPVPPAIAPPVGAPVLPVLKVRTADTEKQLVEKLDGAIKELQAALEQIAKAVDKPEELPKAKEKLEAAKKRLEELKAKLAE